MSNSKKDAMESNFQEMFVKELTKFQWESPDELNGNLRRVTVDDLIAHWRLELNRMNQDQLEGVPLTDNEFNQVMAKVKGINNSYEAAKLLAMEQSKGKIDGIYRDNLPNVSRKQITLTIFEKAKVAGGDSSYKIAREVVSNNKAGGGNRFDIILLINGLPLINIELKRTDKSLDEAYGQFMRYYRDGEYNNNFLAFSQMMVIASEVAAQYFATPKSINDFNKSFVFRWADKNNKVINYWKDVCRNFLCIPMAHQMVGDYLVIDVAKEEENQRHMLMRPYQVYALQAIEKAVFGWDNEDKKPHGGFIWHTTGSGKTITSFKTALFLATRAGLDKVVFLVDRRELDTKTSDDFQAYAEYESVSVDATPYTSTLSRKLQNSESGIIVTTTFKLHSLVKDMSENEDRTLANKKIVFIIDEAHRTTMGQMMGDIRHYFREKGLFYGFTGTPLFEENLAKGMINESSEVINTTEKLFGPLLHKYTIDEAIADRNVLGFNVDYINTGEFESYHTLRNDLAQHMINENPSEDKKQVTRHLLSLSDAELEYKAKEAGILVYHDETHIPQVVKEILEHWEEKSRNREFNAILTVAYKDRVIAYYKEFKKQMAEMSQPLNVAMTFSFGNENDPDNVDPEIVKTMFEDYAAMTGAHYAVGIGEKDYFVDLVGRATRGGSGRNPKNIDLVIVADQLLTGYDSKRLNTLYVDRSIELQNLIQAYSRTNRVFGSSKEFGSIVNFIYPAITAEAVNKALSLYGSGGTSTHAIVEPYEVAVNKLNQAFYEMVVTLPNPTQWTDLENDEDSKKAFETAFKNANGKLNTVMQYYQYQWDDAAFGLSEHQWMHYSGAYTNLKSSDDDETPIEVVQLRQLGDVELAGFQKIDASYILTLIGSKTEVVEGVQYIDDESLRIIHEQIQEFSNLGEYELATLLSKFVDEEVVTGRIVENIKFDDAFEEWKQKQRFNVIKDFAISNGIDEFLLSEIYAEYDISNPTYIPYIEELVVKMSEELSPIEILKKRMSLNDDLKEWLRETKEKFH